MGGSNIVEVSVLPPPEMRLPTIVYPEEEEEKQEEKLEQTLQLGKVVDAKPEPTRQFTRVPRKNENEDFQNVVKRKKLRKVLRKVRKRPKDEKAINGEKAKSSTNGSSSVSTSVSKSVKLVYAVKGNVIQTTNDLKKKKRKENWAPKKSLKNKPTTRPISRSRQRLSPPEKNSASVSSSVLLPRRTEPPVVNPLNRARNNVLNANENEKAKVASLLVPDPVEKLKKENRVRTAGVQYQPKVIPRTISTISTPRPPAKRNPNPSAVFTFGQILSPIEPTAPTQQKEEKSPVLKTFDFFPTVYPEAPPTAAGDFHPERIKKSQGGGSKQIEASSFRPSEKFYSEEKGYYGKN